MTAPHLLAQRMFGTLLRLMPSRFRDQWLAHAEEDLSAALAEIREEEGPGPARRAAWAALWDLARALPREWWKAWRASGRRNPAGMRIGMGEHLMNFWKQLRVAARTLAKRPGYTLAAVWTLAVGIGANVAIFSLVNAVLLRPLPFPDSDHLVTILHHAPGLDIPTLENSPGMLRVYREEGRFLQSMAAHDVQQRNLIGGSQPERVDIVAVTHSLFEVLSTQPAMGRPFVPADEEEGAPSVAILTFDAWQGRFGGDPGILGRSMELDGVSTEIVGVMPKGFAFPDPDPVALVPLYVDPHGPFGDFGLGAVARLAPGVSVGEAQEQATMLQARVPEYFPDDVQQEFLDRAGWSVSVQRLQDDLVGEDTASTLWIVLGTVGFVFLIACANVANLFLVRAESRQKELAIRAAMGAGFRRIAAGFLSEAFLLGTAGALVGLGLAWGGVELLVNQGPQDVPRLQEVGVDGATVAFTGLLSMAAALGFGVIPLFRYGRSRPAGVLRDGGRTATGGRERHRARSLLVAGQLASAMVLLVGSGLMFRSFQELLKVDPGVVVEDLLTVGMSLGENVGNVEAASFYQAVADEVASLPGVSSVGLSTLVPMGGGSSNGGSFYIESRPREEGDLPPVAMYKAIGADYLEATGQRLLRGRALTRTDWNGGPPVALVNEAFANQFFDGEVLGEGISWSRGEEGSFAEVVGVVADAHEYDLQEEVGPHAYLPMIVGDWGFPVLDRSYLFVRLSPGISPPVAEVREIVNRLNAAVPLTSVRTMEEVLSDEMAGTSFTMILLGLAAGMALFLGAVGLFGVISYVVGQRTREIGVRVALGAEGQDIQNLVFRQSAGMALTGAVVGLVGAGALSRVMSSVLFQVSTFDLFSFTVAPAVLVAVVTTATWLPARKASRVDPVEALRSE